MDESDSSSSEEDDYHIKDVEMEKERLNMLDKAKENQRKNDMELEKHRKEIEDRKRRALEEELDRDLELDYISRGIRKPPAMAQQTRSPDLSDSDLDIDKELDLSDDVEIDHDLDIEPNYIPRPVQNGKPDIKIDTKPPLITTSQPNKLARSKDSDSSDLDIDKHLESDYISQFTKKTEPIRSALPPVSPTKSPTSLTSLAPLKKPTVDIQDLVSSNPPPKSPSSLQPLTPIKSISSSLAPDSPKAALSDVESPKAKSSKVSLNFLAESTPAKFTFDNKFTPMKKSMHSFRFLSFGINILHSAEFTYDMDNDEIDEIPEMDVGDIVDEETGLHHATCLSGVNVRLGEIYEDRQNAKLGGTPWKQHSDFHADELEVSPIKGYYIISSGSALIIISCSVTFTKDKFFGPTAARDDLDEEEVHRTVLDKPEIEEYSSHSYCGFFYLLFATGRRPNQTTRTTQVKWTLRTDAQIVPSTASRKASKAISKCSLPNPSSPRTRRKTT